MVAQGFNLKGYTLPLSRTGNSSLVTNPPWYFGAEVMEVSYLTDPELFRQFLPYPLEFSDQPGLVNVTISNMTTVSNQESAFVNPERTNYQECLIRLHCSFNGKKGWFVPNAFVNNDFTLLRGFIQGFGKKLAQIHLTRLDEYNPMIGGKQKGAKLRGICEVFHSVHVNLALQLEEQSDKDRYAGNTMFVLRHFPDMEDQEKLSIHEILELVVSDAIRSEIWEAKGEIHIRHSDFEEITQLQPIEVVSARYFREGYKLLGGKVLYRYEK
ncbi:acetoacetate decarboxylase family protein [Brevibacillus agri]|uniref:acetoacetate decarboxylase family protein n=1 Tax=Brevibacillus agri TaxID=51101 RepID=UPI003D1AA77E